MYKGSKQILKVPAFDLTWLDFDNGDEAVALVPGGGGSTKSGVKNQIQIVSPDEKALTYTCLEGYLTDSGGEGGDGTTGLCSGASTGTLKNGVTVVCTLIDDKFLLLAVDIAGGSSSSPSSKSSSTPSSSSRSPSSSSSKAKTPLSFAFTRLAEVKADFSDNGNGVISTVNTSCIVNVTKVECLDTICRRVSHDYIITGGQDGVVRLWKVAVEDEDEEEDTKYSITKVKDLATHTGAVMSVSYYSDEENQWAVSSSRDGMIKIFDLADLKQIADVPFMSDGLSGTGSKAMTSEPQCRGAVLSRSADAGGVMFLYSIQSPFKGPAHLVQWSVQAKESQKGLNVVPVKALYISKMPVTRLAISNDGLFLAVGDADGVVHILRTQTSLTKYTYFKCHDLSVTGLAFAPTKIAAKAGAVALLASASADRKLAVMPVGTYSTWFTVVSRIIFFLIIVFLCLCAAAILFHVGPLEQFVPRVLVK